MYKCENYYMYMQFPVSKNQNFISGINIPHDLQATHCTQLSVLHVLSNNHGNSVTIQSNLPETTSQNVRPRWSLLGGGH